MNALIASFSRTYRSWSTFKPSVLVFALPVLPPENMTLNAHAGRIHDRCRQEVKCVMILGKDGGVWGKTGDMDNIAESDLNHIASACKEGRSFCTKGGKFMLIRAEDGFAGFLNEKIAAAEYVGISYVGFVVAADGCKLPDCFTVLTKFKAYLSEIRYS